MMNYLNLERETQLRDFDGIIGHITIVMSHSIFLAFEKRCHDSLALERVRGVGVIAESEVLAIVDAGVGFAVDMLQTGKR